MKLFEEQNKIEDNSGRGTRMRRVVYSFIGAAGMFSILLMSGCSLKDVLDPVFGRVAQSEEETASIDAANTLMYAQVNDAEGRSLVKSNGEPLTVLVAYETATGGEEKYDSEGELQTYPLGEPATYTPGTEVTNADGTAETYAGGETVTDSLGYPAQDTEGNTITRAAGEIATHGSADIIYNEDGSKMTYSGEAETHEAGDLMYDTDGELATYAVAIQTKASGENITKADGSLQLGEIELVTDSSGNPYIDSNGEAATKQLEPTPPEQVVDMPIEAGQYYISNILSSYVYFSAPEVEATNIAIVTDEGVDSSQYIYESGEGTVKNLQLESIGDDLPYYEVRYDLEGYAYFVLEGTDQVLTLAGDLRNGVNILPKDMVKETYPQYEYWDDPEYTVADNQKWIIKDQGDGSYVICSAVDENYVMTVDDQYGMQYANIMLWQYDGRDQQKFNFKADAPSITKYIEEGTYYIKSGLSDWMMITLPDSDYYNGSEIYLYPSYQGDGQMLTISYDEYGYAIIKHGDETSNMVLTVSGGVAQNGQSICQYEYDGDTWQKWIIEPSKEGDGGYYIRSALNPSEVLDLSEGWTRSGNSITLHWNNDTYAQYWFFKTEEIASPYNYESMDEYVQNFTSQTEYLLVINSGANVVGVYQRVNDSWQNLYYWTCTTGKSSTPTVTGEFTIYQRTDSFDGNMDSPAWYTVYYATGFYPEYFFHSIIYYQKTWDIMDASLGFNASHGCVRLATENAEWIFNNITNYTKVISY